MDLWSFSLAFYAQRGVATSCLRCQDEAGADVNLLLFLLWQARAGVVFTPDEIAAIDREIASWRAEVVQPLRAVRRYLKGRDADALRDAVKAAELDAERLQQAALTRHARPPGEAPQAARHNVRAYETTLLRPLPDDAVTALLAALAADEDGAMAQ
jgi:uncharacterized protein (TIGR02444 family)